MDKTININLGGTLFQVDEEAYQLLRNYLNAINSRFRGIQGAAETIEDIELRIAEIFQSQRGLAGVISKENVEAMITIIGKPEDFETGDEEKAAPLFPPVRKRMYRNPDDKIISGVCGGIGAYLNTDPVIFRILFALFALCFGTGFLIYLVLWIALPVADSDSRKRELYGDSYNTAMSRERRSTGSSPVGNTSYNSGYYSRSGVSNAFNEIFGAIGRVMFIIMRVFLIIIGVALVATGSLFIVSYIMIFLLKVPGAFSTDAFDANLAYFPDLLKYVVSPSVAPWIIFLATVAFILPVLAIIYWGVKMIFWFRAKDGVYSIIAFIIWVMSATALSIILFNEGISFAETGRVLSSAEIEKVPPTFYIKSGKSTNTLRYDQELDISDEGYTVFINQESRQLYITPYLNISSSGDENPSISINRRSYGRSDIDARKKAEGLEYSYKIIGDTIFLDEYFTIPSDRKWAADNLGVFIYLPEGSRVIFDRKSETLPGLLRHRHDDWNNFKGDGQKEDAWIITEEGLEPLSEGSADRK